MQPKMWRHDLDQYSLYKQDLIFCQLWNIEELFRMNFNHLSTHLSMISYQIDNDAMLYIYNKQTGGFREWLIHTLNYHSNLSPLLKCTQYTPGAELETILVNWHLTQERKAKLKDLRHFTMLSWFTIRTLSYTLSTALHVLFLLKNCTTCSFLTG